MTYTNTIASGKTITITDSSNNQVLSLNNKKEVKYVYFTSSGTGFTLNVGDSSSSTTSTNSTNSTNSTISTTVNLSENIILSYHLFALIILLL